MAGICRNIRILQDPESVSLAQFKSRFACYAIYDIIIGCLFAYEAVQFSYIDEDSEWALRNDWFPIIVAVLFIVDALLITWLRNQINQGASAAVLLRATSINTVANCVTIVFYAAYRADSFRRLFEYGGLFSGSLIFMVIIIAGKVTKVLVIHAFRKWIKRHMQGGEAFVAPPQYQQQPYAGMSQPIIAQPVQQPIFAQPVIAQPVIAQPVIAQPVIAPQPQSQYAPSAPPTNSQLEPGSWLVTCPNGVQAGQLVQVSGPDGRTVTVTVPNGVSPGQQFSVSI